jgi:hypothetical protein
VNTKRRMPTTPVASNPMVPPERPTCLKIEGA